MRDPSVCLSVRLAVPLGPARRAAPRQGHQSLRTADPSEHGRRSAAIGGGISPRRAITCPIRVRVRHFRSCGTCLKTNNAMKSS